MPPQPPQGAHTLSGKDKVLAGVGVLLLAAAVLVIVDNEHHTTHTTTAPSSPTPAFASPTVTSGPAHGHGTTTPAASPSPAPTVGVNDRAKTVAGDYITAYFSQRWTDSSQWAWADRAKQFTDPNGAAQVDTYLTGQSQDTWARDVAAHLVTAASILSITDPKTDPAAPGQLWVTVAYTLTITQDGQPTVPLPTQYRTVYLAITYGDSLSVLVDKWALTPPNDPDQGDPTGIYGG